VTRHFQKSVGKTEPGAQIFRLVYDLSCLASDEIKIVEEAPK